MNINKINYNSNNSFGKNNNWLQRKKHLILHKNLFKSPIAQNVKQAEIFEKQMQETKNLHKKRRFASTKAGFFPEQEAEKKPNIFQKAKSIFKSVKKEFTIKL